MKNIAFKLDEINFKLLKTLIYRITGINLSNSKISMIEGRLAKRLRKLKLTSFEDYYLYIKKHDNSDEIIELINEISTNVSSFYRSSNQFIYLNEVIEKKRAAMDKKLTIWSAGCAGGQEAYSILIYLIENIDDFISWDIKILASDIAQHALQSAIEGIYNSNDLKTMPIDLKQIYFKSKIVDKRMQYRINNRLEKYIKFRKFNLVYDNYNILNARFDIIFCRNVLIYFDEDTRFKVLYHLAGCLKKDGLIFLGSAETATTASFLNMVHPNIYEQKKGDLNDKP